MARIWQGMAVALVCSVVGNAANVVDTVAFRHPETKLTIVRGRLALPGEGYWQLDRGQAMSGDVEHVELKVPPEVLQAGRSQRVSAGQHRRLIWRGRSPLRQFHRAAEEYAKNNNGAMPQTVAQLATGNKNPKWIEQRFTWNPYGNDVGSKPGPQYAILPGLTFTFKDPEKKTGNANERVPYIVELRPLYADGKQWVLFADQHMERVAIDQELMAKHGLTVDAYLPDPDAPPPVAAAAVDYFICAIQTGKAPASFVVVNLLTGEKQPCAWNHAANLPGQAEIAKEWATLRVGQWAQYILNGADSSILRLWGRALQRQYGAESPKVDDPRNRRNRRDRSTDVFGVLGGRAAMRETFQMDALRPRRNTEGIGTPIADIPGVEVKSHPFREMLKGETGGSLAIAEAVPLDRFMLYIRKPDALLPMLGQGARFMSRVGASATGHSLSYQLEDRYLARLGMGREWLEQFLKSGLVTEMALVLPDLFVVDGTEITVISRVPQLTLLKPLLAAVGAKDLADGRVTAVRLADGRDCYWSAMGNLVVVSTNREEIDRVLTTKGGRTESLGKSDEFRYMLLQLAPTERTRMFAYFSDPFIRRLVGPEVKIAQLRRLQEKARLEALTAGVLLYQADGHAEPPTVEILKAAKYLSPGASWSGLSLDAQYRARSKDYGRLDHMATISSCPVLLATAEETEAYKQYVQAYTRFWRRFFDPIAVRLDDTEDGGLTVETFILPLLDNSVYSRVRDTLGGLAGDQELRVPKLSPEPVMLASLNLGERVWRDILGDMFRRQGNRGFTAALDKLGPAVHIAVHDSDPIIAFGSGEMLGLGGTVMGRGRSQMLAIPVFISLLTRPLTIAVETSDPEPIRQFLETGVIRQMVPWQREMGADASWYRLGDKDAWVLGMNVFGIGIRFRFQLQDNYLMISNLPWMERSRVEGADVAAMRALEIRLRPDLVEEQLAAMFTAAHERQRRAAFSGMGYLLPFVDTGLGVEDGLQEHRRLLGFAPVHPPSGTWAYEDGRLVSSAYGSIHRPTQPEYAEGSGRFGLLQGVSGLRIGLQFEDDGLRTRVGWTYSAK